MSAKNLLSASDVFAKIPGELAPTIGLLITNVSDCRLLLAFLQECGYQVRSGVPSELVLDDWAEISMSSCPKV